MADKTSRILKQLRRPAPKGGNPVSNVLHIPNKSGDLSFSNVRKTAAKDFDIANKKYVDDNAGGINIGSSTDNAIARWNGTTGTAIQNSGVLIDDSNNLFLPTGTKIDFNSGDVTLTHSSNVIQLDGGGFFIDNTSTEAFLIRKNGDTGDIFTIDSTNGTMVVNADTDSQHTAGRFSVNAATADNMAISHYDQRASATKYALRQTSTGKTVLNTATATTLVLAVEGSQEIEMSTTAFKPVTDDGMALGESGKGYADLFLADGGTIDWSSNNASIVHSTNSVDFQFGGASALAVTSTSVTSQKQIIIDTSVSEALRVNRNGDSEDIFVVDTLNRHVTLNAAQVVKRTTSAAGNYTILVSDYIVAKTGITGGGDTLTLPAAASAGAGFVLVIKDESGTAATNNITVDGNASETIDGSATQTINTNYGSLHLYCDGSNWFII